MALVITAGLATVTGQGTTGGGVVIGESGAVDTEDFIWVYVEYNNAYDNSPVVIATMATDNAGEDNAPIATIKDITTTGFNITFCKDMGDRACDTSTVVETIHYMVFDVDAVADLDWIAVGTTGPLTPNGGNNAVSWGKTLTGVPMVFSAVNTYNQPDGDLSATIWVDGETISATGANEFIPCVHIAPAESLDVDQCTGSTIQEQFGWVAIDIANAEIDGLQSGNADISNSAWTAAIFSPSFTNPIVAVLQNDDDGGQDPQYPWARDVTGSGMDYRYCEQDAIGVCHSHTGELVVWFAVEKGDITVSGPTFTAPVQIWPKYPFPSPPYSDTVSLPNPTLYVYQPVPNAPYLDYQSWPDALTLLAEAGNETNKLNTLLVIRNWGNDTDGKESELRFDSGAWNSSDPGNFSYMQAAIYTRGTDQVLRLKPGPFVTNPSVLGQLRVLNTNGAFITQIVANKSNAASLSFVETNKRDSGNETASIYRPGNSRDLRVYMTGFGPVMTFVGDDDGIKDNVPGPYVGNIGIGTTNPKTKLEVSSVIKSTPTDNPGNCNADSEGGMYYDASLNEPCFCDGVNWKQFDGDGNC